MFGGGRCFRGGRQLSGNSLQFEKVKNSTFFKLWNSLAEKRNSTANENTYSNSNVKSNLLFVCWIFSIFWQQFIFCCWKVHESKAIQWLIRWYVVSIVLEWFWHGYYSYTTPQTHIHDIPIDIHRTLCQYKLSTFSRFI